ncbi:MAG: HRDC domain-containing protein [Streptosporangiaceae bacterium]
MSAGEKVDAYDGPHDGQGAVPLLEPREGLPPVVETSVALAEVTDRLARGEGPVAVDAERASGYRYGQRAYLVQLRRAGAGTVLIDPIACPELSGLDAALDGAEAVLHAASQDLPCLAELGFRPRQLFDTELAGRLLGYPRVALGTLVEEVLGFHLEKGHSAADWSVRPLRTELLRYAALDVEVLIELRDALAGELAAQGKTQWARQEFEAVLAARPVTARADPWRRTSGIHRVQSRRALAVVRELWITRDKIAQAVDLSPRRVLPDTAIIEAARSLPVSTGQLMRIGGFAGRQARRHEREWLAAITRARTGADSELPDPTGGAIPNGPPPAHRWAERDPVAAARLAATRAAVAAIAEASRLPVENLLSPDVLRRLSWDPPQPSDPVTVGAALASYGARAWQVEFTAGPVAEALNAGKSKPPDPGDTEHGDAG